MIQKLPVNDSVANILYTALKLEGIFPGFNAEHARKNFSHSSLYLYPKGTRIVAEGDNGRDLYILCKGKLDVVRKQEGAAKPIGALKEGDVFGEMGLLGDGVRSATVTAAKDCEIFWLHYSDVEELLMKNKKLGEHLEKIIRERFNL